MYTEAFTKEDAPEWPPTDVKFQTIGSAKPKIASRIIGRSLKPIRGMFYGLPKSKLFLQACDKLGQDMALQNCGPGFLLRKAL